MWAAIARIILRNRFVLLSLLLLATVFMGYRSRNLEMSYGIPRLLPKEDSTNVAYEDFRTRYGRESEVYMVGIDKNPLEDLKLFRDWHQLGNDLNAIDGVDTVVSLTNNIFNIRKNSEKKKFELERIVESIPQTQEELDSIRNVVESLPFYRNRLYNDSTGVNIMLVTVDTLIFDSDNRKKLVDNIQMKVDAFESSNEVSVFYTGLPYIRSVITFMLRKELGLFVGLAILVTILILFFFFRTFNPVAVSMIVVAIGVVMSLGTIELLGYKVTILTGLIPPLIIVIGVPNCIFLINKYHSEYRNHGNKAMALTRVIQKIGAATFMTNATTAMGFFTFVFTHSAILQEFGVVASINILIIFLVALIVIPVAFSFIKPPKTRHTKHLDKKWLNSSVEWLVFLVTKKRSVVYLVTILLVGVSLYGVSLIETTGNMVDDLPKDHRVLKDLKTVEKHFKGVMPFEFSLDAMKPGYATKDHTLKKIEQLQEMMENYPQFSKPLSIIEGIKFTKQAYYNGNPKKYTLINNQEKVFFKPYMESGNVNKQWLNSIIDSTQQYTRVSYQMADVGTKEMDKLLRELQPRVDSIFSRDKYDVAMTGASVTFLKGTNYLRKNLFISLFIAILLVAVIMASLFSSFKMILVSIATNLLPLLFTAAAMGFFGIPIKPSTILVFSIAFGISVDDTIHYLAKYRLELKSRSGDRPIFESAVAALRETGVSMIYTSIVLFFGFSVFISSQFGGTMALGMLVSFTLLIAMMANLILLPSFLLTIEKGINMKAFRDTMVVIYDEEEDIALDKLEIRKENDVIENKAENDAKNKSEDSINNENKKA